MSALAHFSMSIYNAEASKYAMEGFDSVLWNLCLANLQDDIRRCAANYRSVMTVERVLAMLNDEQSGNWSDRAFNKSGYLKYIAPATREMYGKIWPFIYALQGSNAAHRAYFIKNRFALLDAIYGTSNFTSDNIDLYMARAADDAADRIRVTSSEPYAFGYGTNNSPNIANTGLVADGAEAEIAITGAYTVNDPLRVYGASRIKKLDMTSASDHLKNGLDLGKCAALRELNLQSSGSGSTGWWLSISNCRQLRKLNLRNQAQAKTGGSTSTALDLTNQTRLEDLDARGTKVQSVNFAKGAPVTSAKLPATITTLRLEYLARLTQSSLTLENYGNVKTIVFDNCPLLNWETLLQRCSNTDRIRVTGIDRDDDGTWLNKFMTMGGVDTDGNSTDTCALVGTVRLTRYMEQERYDEMCAHFPELNIIQPEYSVVVRDTSVMDDANISNLDNSTGYMFGNDYEPSGHVLAIKKKRHRVLAKMTGKPTTRKVTIANTETTMNNLDGEMTYYPLHDGNSNYYADATEIRNCSAAKLDSSEGDIMMYEPWMWFKGVYDYLNHKQYDCYSSNDRNRRPATPDAKILTWEQLVDENRVTDGKKIVGKSTLATSFVNDSAFSVCQIEVDGYRRVRFPSVPGTSLVGAVFSDESGNVIDNVVVPTLSSKFLAGMYVIKDVPEGAVTLSFTIRKTAMFDKVVLSNSDKIEDMEPEWVFEDEYLCGVIGTSIVNGKFRSCVNGSSSQNNMSWVDFNYYSAQRGMQQIDWLMHNRIANLFYAFHGRRDAQEVCGAGSHSNWRTAGGTMSHGMQETIGYEAAKIINPDVTNSLVDNNLIHQYAWYANGTGETVEQVNNISCLGYEDIYGHKYDMMDCVDVPNSSGKEAHYRIWMPDGSIRWVPCSTASGTWITEVVHGLYMDMVPAAASGGSSSTYYCDYVWYSGAAGRVVYRGHYYAYAYGGVSCAYAGYDASDAGTHVGSRLAFRGKLVKAQSVTAYKAIVEVA
jgi:hypothetical protein